MERQNGDAGRERFFTEEFHPQWIEDGDEVVVGIGPRTVYVLAEEDVKGVEVIVLELLDDDTVDVPQLPLARNKGVPEFAAWKSGGRLAVDGERDLLILSRLFLVGAEV